MSLESIAQMLILIEFDVKTTKDLLQKLIDEEDATYTLVTWPESQEYMEESWFDKEAILNLDQSSSYFIPTIRLKQ